MRITVEDSATPFLQNAARQLQNPLPLMQAATKAVHVRVVKHFASRQAAGNKKNWPEQKFWHGGRNSVSNNTAVGSVSAMEGIVVIADLRFIHKVTGGTITPKRKSALIIPLRAEAYALGGKGSIQGKVDGLFLLKTRKGAWLVKWKVTRVKGQKRGGFGISNEGLEFWFRLVKSVDQPADPNALPAPEEITRTIEDAAAKALPLLLDMQNRKN